MANLAGSKLPVEADNLGIGSKGAASPFASLGARWWAPRFNQVMRLNKGRDSPGIRTPPTTHLHLQVTSEALRAQGPSSETKAHTCSGGATKPS